MNGVEPITIPEDVAKAKLKAYRTNVHRDAEQQYKEAAAAYEEAAKGLPLLDLSSVFADPPTDAKRRPRLAIARADRREVWLHDGFNSDRYRFDAREAPPRYSPGRVAPQLDLTFRRQGTATWPEGYAPVPMIPADVRPEKGNLRDWFILWEVDVWADRARHAPPPTDPLLLKHVGGTLYAVLAEWDLSPLERAIMAGALRA